jgi:hypothetical protein
MGAVVSLRSKEGITGACDAILLEFSCRERIEFRSVAEKFEFLKQRNKQDITIWPD